MAVVELPIRSAWDQAEAETVAAMGQINLGTARLVRAIQFLLATEGWAGEGIQSPEHWVGWKAGVSRHRTQRLVRIARRADDLPACWALFEAGRLTEDAMALIARRVPAGRDAEVAAWAPDFLHSQLARALASCPELPDGVPRSAPDPRVRTRSMHSRAHDDGWVEGTFCLPPEEGAELLVGLAAARDAAFRDRHDLEEDADLDGGARSSVSWCDAFVRLVQEGTDALDHDLQRSGRAGDRHQVVIHRDLHPDGTLGPAQLHLGGLIPDPVARYLGCDASVVVASYAAGRLIGIDPTVRTPSRALRRTIERRDQGCTHPLCSQRRWLQIHHLVHWEDGGPTTPANLLCLCPAHHRAHHRGEFTITGDPEDRSLRFLDRWGGSIGPPDIGPPPPTRSSEPTPFRSPTGERLDPLCFSWN